MPTTTNHPVRATVNDRNSCGVQIQVNNQLQSSRGVAMSKNWYRKGVIDDININQLKYVQNLQGMTGDVSESSSKERYGQEISEANSRGGSSLAYSSSTLTDRFLSPQILPSISDRVGHVVHRMPAITVYRNINNENNTKMSGNKTAFRILHTRATNKYPLQVKVPNRLLTQPVISGQMHGNHEQFINGHINRFRICPPSKLLADSESSLGFSTLQSSILNQAPQNDSHDIRAPSIQTPNGRYLHTEDMSQNYSTYAKVEDSSDRAKDHAAEAECTDRNVLCPPSENIEELCEFVENDIVGANNVAVTAFGATKLTYVDYIASGRPLKCFELYIRQHVLPTYSNTHTEVSFNAQQTSHFRDEARNIIRECVNALDDDAVIFTGSGATAAINKLVHAMDIRTFIQRKGVTVFVGPYEHHSNILPWREMKARVVTIPQTEAGLIDLVYLKSQLKKCRCGPEKMLIGSFSAASNVTGILTDVNSVASLMHEYGGYVFFDYACAAPYTDIDMNPLDPQAYKDAVFISAHKFIGGPQTPGILVAKKWLFRNAVPHNVGGGTVAFVRRRAHIYLSSVEEREEGGTPAIIESIRAGLAFKLKAALTPRFIMTREMEMVKLAKAAWRHLPGLVILGNLEVDRLPIFSMLFLNKQTGRFVHHDFIARILNDVFGIQDLLGISESLGERYEELILVKAHKIKSKTRLPEKSQLPEIGAKNLMFKPGFVRLSFPYFMSESCFKFILKAIAMTAEKGWLLLPLYDCDRHEGKWTYVNEAKCPRKKSLRDITFQKGDFYVKKVKGQAQEKQLAESMVDNVSVSSSPPASLAEALSYSEILNRAERIFAAASEPKLLTSVKITKQFFEKDEPLRWFMLPKEALDIINRRPVKHVKPTDLPFLPEALRKRIAGENPPVQQ